MKKTFISLLIALAPAFAFMSCTEDSASINTGNTSIGTADDDDDDNDKYDFSVVYNGQTIYFKIDATAVNECYVTHGNYKDWIVTDKETGDGYYPYYAGAVEIPSQVTYNGTTYTVSGIGYDAFWSTNLTSVSIPSTVKYFGNWAFGSTLLTSITIPSSVEKIGYGAFPFCENLKEIIVEDGNADYTSVDGVLYTKDMTTLVAYPGGKTGSNFTVENFVDSVVYGAFRGNENLKSLTIESNTLELSSEILYCSSNFESVIVRDDNPNYATVDGVLYNKNLTDLICYPQGKTEGSFTVPATVKRIKSGAFKECSNLRAVTMQDGLTIMQNSAFEECENLRSVVIPSTTKQIITYAFNGCMNLSSITIYVTEPFEIDEQAFFAWDEDDGSNSVIYKNATLHVPAGTKTAYQNTDCWNYFEHIVEMEE